MLAACSSGPRYATLDAKQAAALDLILVGGGTTFCVHGGAPQLKAVVTLSDGKRLETWSHGQNRDGTIDFENLELSASFGLVDRAGQVQVGGDPFAVMDRELEIAAAIAGRTEVNDSLTLRPTFDCGAVIDVSAAAGPAGLSGASGRAGRAGGSGDSSREATDGESGGDGQDGGDGGRGDDGPAIEVAVGYVESQVHGRLALVRVGAPSRGGAVRYLLLNPRAGKRFVISARGGPGGYGGAGGAGGAGGPGGSNNVQDAGDGGHGGDGGDGGRGGNGGDGGDGGQVVVRFDARSPELQGLVAVVTAGGAAGGAGSGGYAGGAGTGGSSASGKRGTNGRAGVAGQPGVAGRAGRDGPAPEYAADDSKRLFSVELARGLPIVN